MGKYNYIITIKQPDYKTANIISLLMLILAMAAFIRTAWVYCPSRAYHNAAILYAVFSGIILTWSVYCIAFAPKLKRVPYYRLALAAAAVGWFVEPLSNIWLGALYAIAALIERQVKFPVEIGADDSGIVFNSLPVKSFQWNEIDNLLLKDNMITIDFKNNKIYQKEIEADVSAVLEREFNAFCSSKLHGMAITPAE